MHCRRATLLKVETTPIDGLLIVTPRVFADDRGWFFESFNEEAFADSTGVRPEFVQDNHSRSARGVLRGLHYQAASDAQGKLVRCAVGNVFDVAVDIRRSSPTFMQWFGLELSSENKKQLWIPEGFAHGFVALSDTAELLYKATDYYAPASDRSIRWDDPMIGIQWPVFVNGPVLSDKDAAAPLLSEAEVFA